MQTVSTSCAAKIFERVNSCPSARVSALVHQERSAYRINDQVNLDWSAPLLVISERLAIMNMKPLLHLARLVHVACRGIWQPCNAKVSFLKHARSSTTVSLEFDGGSKHQWVRARQVVVWINAYLGIHCGDLSRCTPKMYNTSAGMSSACVFVCVIAVMWWSCIATSRCAGSAGVSLIMICLVQSRLWGQLHLQEETVELYCLQITPQSALTLSSRTSQPKWVRGKKLRQLHDVLSYDMIHGAGMNVWIRIQHMAYVTVARPETH